jgi:hypothetical protein
MHVPTLGLRSRVQERLKSSGEGLTLDVAGSPLKGDAKVRQSQRESRRNPRQYRTFSKITSHLVPNLSASSNPLESNAPCRERSVDGNPPHSPFSAIALDNHASHECGDDSVAIAPTCRKQGGLDPSKSDSALSAMRGHRVKRRSSVMA